MSAELSSWLARVSDPLRVPWSERDEESMPPLTDAADAARADPIADFERNGDDDDGEYRYRGGRDDDGRPHGTNGRVSWGDGVGAGGGSLVCDFRHGVRCGDGVVQCDADGQSSSGGLSRLVGVFEDGLLQGRGTMIGVDTTTTDCVFRSSVLHGPCRKIALKKFREFRRQLTFFGRYRNGRPWGPCWIYKEGSGFLVGRVDDKSGEFTGDALSYVYPDLRTALVGQFRNGVMVAARPAEVVGVDDSDPLVLMPKTSAVDASRQAVGYAKSTRTSVGPNPLVPDPYESRWVRVGASLLPGAGEGLFARRDIAAGSVAAFYNGVRIPYQLGGPKEEWATSGYKIFVNADYTSGERMDVPGDLISLQNYCASLGHKVNHSFSPNVTTWFFEHPRFGVVPCLRAARNVAGGEELTLDYEYDPYNAPEWFSAALEDFVAAADEEALDGLSARYDRYVRGECGRTDHRKYNFPPLGGQEGMWGREGDG